MGGANRLVPVTQGRIANKSPGNPNQVPVTLKLSKEGPSPKGYARKGNEMGAFHPKQTPPCFPPMELDRIVNKSAGSPTGLSQRVCHPRTADGCFHHSSIRGYHPTSRVLIHADWRKRIYKRMRQCGLIAVLVLPWTLGAAPVDFDREIRSIFAERCLQCHGGVKHKANLTFLSRDAALAPAESGKRAIDPEHPEASELLRRISSADPEERMPPQGPPLSSTQQAMLRQWIQEGANWPQHWSFRPLEHFAPPQIQNRSWLRNPIDQFVLVKLEAKGIAPSPAADRVTLIRRLYLDLLGLPPPIEAVDAFAQDSSPEAYEQLVDRLLQSPHFGERWGRHWLDQARYADSDGYEKDNARPDAWRWRAWVIDAINQDLPFDQFTLQQIAGDLIPHASADQKLGTAFNLQTLFNREGGVDPEEDRTKRVIDRVNTISTVWLGLTVGCTQCHDHPYDSVQQKDFYRLYAFFNNADETMLDVPKDFKVSRDFKLEELRTELELARKDLAARLANWESRQLSRNSHEGPELPEEISLALTTESSRRAPEQRSLLAQYYEEQIDGETAPLHFQIGEHNSKQFMAVRVLAQRTDPPRTTYVFHRGDFLQPDTAEVLQPAPPATLTESRNESWDRIALARWLVANPLTPRVRANKIWATLFGQGLVTTLDDFGTRGDRPTHPELLDWLAERYQKNWRLKDFLRLILNSATYRQSSSHRPELQEIDPDNQLWHRQNRLRVEGEIIRDMHLSVSGLLEHRVGSPSVFPPLASDVAALSYADNFKWQTSEGPDRYRRGMYTFFKRTAPDPNLMIFDCPDANVTATGRTRSNTPIQALTALQNEVYVEAARALSQRALTLPQGNDEERLRFVWRLSLARSPQPQELAPLLALLQENRAYYRVHAEQARELGGGTDELAAWVATVRIILNLDEFITRG